MNEFIEPVDGAGALITNIGAELSAVPNSQEMLNFLSNINTFLNATIGLIVTLVVVLLCFQLARWVFFGESPTGKKAAEAAIRAFFALFLIVSIWSLIRILQQFISISPPLAYAIVLCSFIIVGCWSLLGIGQAVLDGIAALGNYIAGKGIAVVRRSTSSKLRFLRSRTDMVLRFIALAVVLVPLALTATFWSYGTSQQSEPAPEFVWAPLDPSRRDIPIAFPAEWQVTHDMGTSTLILTAEHASSTMSLLGSTYVGELTGDGRLPHAEFLWLLNQSLRVYIDAGWGVQTYNVREASIGEYEAYSVYTGFLDPGNPWSSVVVQQLFFGKDRVYYGLYLNTPLDGVSDAERLAYDETAWQSVLDSLVANSPQE